MPKRSAQPAAPVDPPLPDPDASVLASPDAGDAAPLARSTAKRKGERRREAILKAAYRRFRDVGYHETTVDDICAAADSSKGSFYWYYASKQEVFIDILETWTREVMDQMYVQFQPAVRAEDYIRATTEALAREIRRGRVIVPLWLDFTVHARNDAEVREALGRFYRRARAAVAEMLRPGLEGILPEAGLQGVAATVFGAYTGLLMQELADPDRADAREAMQQFMALFGQFARPQPPPLHPTT